MLSIETVDGQYTEFHVGDDHPRMSVTSLQADCDELDLIRRQFSGIPMTAWRVMLWRGEWAQFIADNIRLKEG